MSGWKNFFAMTRRERRGTIVVLAVIAMLTVATLAQRSCRDDVPRQAAQQAELLEFEQLADSARLTVQPSKSKRGPKDRHAKRARKAKGDKHKKSPVAPRPVDPVPQF